MLFLLQVFTHCVFNISFLTDPCRSAPCKNGAHCNWIGGLNFTCTCQWGYTGNLCDYGKFIYIIKSRLIIFFKNLVPFVVGFVILYNVYTKALRAEGLVSNLDEG